MRAELPTRTTPSRLSLGTAAMSMPLSRVQQGVDPRARLRVCRVPAVEQRVRERLAYRIDDPSWTSGRSSGSTALAALAASSATKRTPASIVRRGSRLDLRVALVGHAGVRRKLRGVELTPEHREILERSGRTARPTSSSATSSTGRASLSLAMRITSDRRSSNYGETPRAARFHMSRYSIGVSLREARRR